MPAARPVVLVVYDGFQLLDDAGPADVFAAASRLAGVDGTGYRLTTVAASAEPVRASNGTAVLVDGALDDVRGRIDTVMVVGAFEMSGRPIGPDLVDGVRRLARSARRVASVCSGALVLAEAGLLAGRRATTHWFVAPTLARRHPDVAVESDRIYVHDGQVWTSAGVTAGIDLALAMVADDLGPDLAREVARWLVAYLHRPGGQNQFSSGFAGAAPADGTAEVESKGFRALRSWMAAHPAADLSVPALAERAHMSVRHFSRCFAAQVGMPPGRYVERVRADSARRALESTDPTHVVPPERRRAGPRPADAGWQPPPRPRGRGRGRHGGVRCSPDSGLGRPRRA